MDKNSDYQRIARFLYEVGTLRRLPRIHCQTLLENDLTDNIASHSFRVALTGWQLAKLEKADPYKTAILCLVHDLAEIRSNDHNWIHKRYVKVFEDEILADQLGTLPDKGLFDLATEYNRRQSKEAIIAKDADLLDQILLLKEYELKGSREAKSWLFNKAKVSEDKEPSKLKDLKTQSAKKLGQAIYKESPSSWWAKIWTDNNR